MTDKLKSRKLWIVIWACVTFSMLALYCIITKYDASWLAITMPILIGIPAAYVGIGASKKKKEE